MIFIEKENAAENMNDESRRVQQSEQDKPADDDMSEEKLLRALMEAQEPR